MVAEASSSATETINDTEEVTSSEVTERKKRSIIWGYFVVCKEDACR